MIERFRTQTSSLELGPGRIVAEPGRSFERVAGGSATVESEHVQETHARKTRAAAASLVLAIAAISSSAASAEYYPGDPDCSQQVVAECATKWQAWGYHNYADCARMEPCLYCMYGYVCGWIDYWAPGKHGSESGSATAGHSNRFQVRRRKVAQRKTA